jgi:hypothetical protein
MEDVQKPKWDYVLCRQCRGSDAENFVLGDDVNKSGIGSCPTCGSTIYHVKCEKCGDEYDIGQKDKEFHAEDNTWQCYCGQRQALPTGKITIIRDLPPELENEPHPSVAIISAKLRKLGLIILFIVAIHVILFIVAIIIRLLK